MLLSEDKNKDQSTIEKPKVAIATKDKASQAEEIVEEKPSPLEPLLRRFVDGINEVVGSDAIEEAYVNRAGEHVPYLIINKDKWLEVATLLKTSPLYSFNYVRNLSAVDYTTHMEVVYHLYSFNNDHQIGIRVKIDRENPTIHTATYLWSAANWTERECYDLFGIIFENHPNLKRILMPDDWEGYPLRKDYEPLDKEV